MSISEFISSLDFDKNLLEYDLKGSIAHCKMLAKCGIITADDSRKIINGLKGMLADFKKGKLLIKGEDIHMAMEQELIKRIGILGGKLHTARSRNDQVVLDEKLYLKDVLKHNIKSIASLIGALKSSAVKYKDAVMPGYTHLQEAQPVLFSHYITAYCWMFLRDAERLKDCYKRTDSNPLGSCALAGTSFPIDRKYTSELLGFKNISENSIDAVSDRDFIIEYIAAVSIYMMHLSRIAEDFIIWSSTPFGFVKLGGKYSSGSSIMPQKRNPDYLELLRAQSSLVYGKLVSMLVMLKGLPLSYNRDMQDDKRMLFDTAGIFKKSSDMAAGFFSELKLDAGRMKEACSCGYLEATELADYLAGKGVPFRKSHGIVKEIVAYAAKNKSALKDINMKKYRQFSSEFQPDIYDRLKIENIVKSKISEGSTGNAQVKIQLDRLQRKINELQKI